MEYFQKAQESLRYIQGILPSQQQSYSIGIVCGSGLGGLANSIRKDIVATEIDYNLIPQFPKSTVEGHAGKLVFGVLKETEQPVVLMVGRAHFYEGHSMYDIAHPVRTLKLLGVKVLIVTNAAGGLNNNFDVGDIMILNDHLNLAGLSGIHPLRGPNVDQLGDRFPPLSDAYDLDLRRRAHQAWNSTQVPADKVHRSYSNRKIHEGVYAFVGGPSYETRAECRMLRTLGADAVGMSTVPEVVVARHSGMRVLAMSLVTNLAVLDPGPKGNDPSVAGADAKELAHSQAVGKANHQEVLEAGLAAAECLQMLILEIVKGLPTI